MTMGLYYKPEVLLEKLKALEAKYTELLIDQTKLQQGAISKAA